MARSQITIKELESKFKVIQEKAISEHKPKNIGCGQGCNLYIYPTGEAVYFAYVPKEDKGYSNVKLGSYKKITAQYK